MTTRSMGPGAGLSWLSRAVNLGRHSPRTIFGAIALLALVALVPSLVQAFAQHVLGLGPGESMGAVGVLSLVMVLVYPLLIGGVLRVIDAAEHGRPTRATAVFDTFRSGNGGLRLVGFGVLMFLLNLVVFGTVIGLFGKDVVHWYLQLLEASAQPDQKLAQAAMAQALQDMPPSFGTVMALGSLATLFFGGVYAIGLGQVALGARGVLAAFGDGLAGTLKNLLPLLILAVVVFVAAIGLIIVVSIVASLLLVLGSFVHVALGLALAMPVYFGMLMVMYVVMFGVMYYLWRDVCAGDVAPPAVRDDRIEL